MKVVVKHPVTKHYLGSEAKWVPDAGNARDFLSTVRALPFCEANKILDYQIVLHFGDAKFDIVLDHAPPRPSL